MKRFVTIYRMGGTVNFSWHRALPTMDRREADQQAADISRGGRAAFVADYDLSMAIGLPETFDAPGSRKARKVAA